MAQIIDRWEAVQPRLTKLAERLTLRAVKAQENATEYGESYRAVRKDDEVPAFVVSSLRMDEHRNVTRADRYLAQSRALVARAAKGPEIVKPRASWKLAEMDRLDGMLREGKLRAKDYRRIVGVLFHANDETQYKLNVESGSTKDTAVPATK
jgi:hypothetical protein